MARNKTTLQINAEYYSVRGLFALLRKLPLDWATALCSFLLNGLLFLLPKRRKIMMDNLQMCFPQKTSVEREAIAHESMQNLARGIACFPRIPDWATDGLENWVEFHGFDHVNRAMERGRGAIAFTAHYGFWEIMAIILHQNFPRVQAVGRALDNPRLDRLISTIRSANGVSMLSHHELLRQGLRILRRNQILGILVDQNLYKGGVFVDFFGQLAATTHAVSLLARRTGCAVIPAYSIWTDNKVHAFFGAPLTLSEDPNAERAVAEDTQQMTKVVEDWIRKDPGQWLWIHNRWKRRPAPGDIVYTPQQAERQIC